MRVQDSDLVPLLETARGVQRVLVAVSLGDAEGDTGPSALRGLICKVGPGTSDLRCAALLALAKRCGEEANEDYAVAFRARDASVRDYALLALAAFGADGLWDDAAARLKTTLGRRERRLNSPSNVLLMTTYLARHAGRQPERLANLAGLLRNRWDKLDAYEERPWMSLYWPELATSHPPLSATPPPDHRGMQRWVREHPLLRSRLV